MSMLGKMSTGIRRPSPIASRLTRINTAATVYGLPRTYRTNDIGCSLGASAAAAVSGLAINDGPHARIGILQGQAELMQAHDRGDDAEAQSGPGDGSTALAAI